MKQKLLFLMLLFVSLCFINGLSAATKMASDRISDIRNTKHNFAANDVVALPDGSERNVRAETENQVCIFCHTPHGDPNVNINERPFLWNRVTSGSGFTRYQSSSMDLNQGILGQGSKMCLSCHDGTVAIGQLDVINGRLGSEVGDVSMVGSNVNAGVLTGGSGNLGQDLKNDHPIGFLYNSQLVIADGELISPSTDGTGEGAHIGVPVGRGLAQNNAIVEASESVSAGANQPVSTSSGISVPLESVVTGLGIKAAASTGSLSFVNAAGTGSVECTSCHDPHIRSTDNALNIKFLRLRRFQTNTTPVPVDGFKLENDINCLGCHKKAGWATSVHATDTSQYNTVAAESREFKDGIQLWEAACLNCHAPHTNSNARWLLSKGNENSGRSDIENTCFQCHGSSGILDASVLTVDIETVMLSNPHGDSGNINDQSMHQIDSSNFDEEGADLKGINRHVTCSDCHNSHRMIKNAAYDGAATADQATHTHGGSSNAVHSNKASGALRGVMGVEPDYSSVGDTFAPFDNSLAYSGDPFSTATGNTETNNVLTGDPSLVSDNTKLVSKEYQVCLKCHSTYGNTVNLAVGTKDIAMEFQPVDDATRQVNNHNSWHPVVGGTDTTTPRVVEVNVNNFTDAFDQGLGTQTMYCSDCHNNSLADLSDPTDSVANAKGSHGSANANMLIAPWNEDTGTATPNDLCFKCHNFDAYANIAIIASADNKSNFSGGGFDNLHLTHALRATNTLNADVYTCSLCHVKSGHGWKNKAFLVDKNVADASLDAVYYSSKAKLSINTYRVPGTWTKVDCSGCH